jgi:hypothetical protein
MSRFLMDALVTKKPFIRKSRGDWGWGGAVWVEEELSRRGLKLNSH